MVLLLDRFGFNLVLIFISSRIIVKFIICFIFVIDLKVFKFELVGEEIFYKCIYKLDENLGFIFFIEVIL